MASCRALETPQQQDARRDAELATALANHLQALPGVTKASVVVHAMPTAITLVPQADAPCTPQLAAILTAVADADVTALGDAASRQLRAIVPAACPPTVTVLPPSPTSAAWASVGPFRVAPASKRPLQGLLATLLLALAWLVMRSRRAREAWPA